MLANMGTNQPFWNRFLLCAASRYIIAQSWSVQLCYKRIRAVLRRTCLWLTNSGSAGVASCDSNTFSGTFRLHFGT